MQGITESFRCFTCASIGCEMAAVLKSRAPRLDALYERVGYLGSSVYHQLTVHLASSKCSVSNGYLGSTSFLSFSSSFLRGLKGLVHQTMRISSDRATAASRSNIHMISRLLYIYEMPL
jgi:hypothetical protein